MRFSTLALIGLVGAAPVLAQDNRGILPPRQVRVMIQKYAQCLARTRTEQVRTAIAGAWGKGDADLPINDECVRAVAYESAEMTVPDSVYVRAVAEAIYRRDFGGTPPAGFDAVPLVAPPQIAPLDEAALPSNKRRAEAIRADYASRVADRYLAIVGDCVARTDPVATHQLLTTDVETKEETLALGALRPTLARCLPQGQTVSLDRSSVRGMLALAAYTLRTKLSAPSIKTGTL